MPKRRSLESAGISDAQYLQIMERVAEQNYKDWGLPTSDAALVQALNDNTYNYRGYYTKYPNSRANANTHWTDEFKTVYHPTFSRESKYSGKKSQYNPKGLVGGTWSGETFIPASWQRNKFRKGGSTDGNNTNNGGLFGNEAVDNVASFLPILGTLEDAYGFYKNPTWANAGWLAASLASDIFTGGMAGRAVKAFRLANKANDAAKATNMAARKTWEVSKRSMASGTGRGADNLRNIRALQAAGATRQASIRRANDALFDAGVKIGIDQGVNGFLNAAQLDMLPDLREDRNQKKDGGIHIAPSKRGTFTAAATKHGMGVQEFASRVLRNKDSYSTAMVKKANFARNASKWN